MKYHACSWNLFQAFNERINQIKTLINNIKEDLKDYKDHKIDKIKEKEKAKLDEMMKNLFSFEKEADDGYKYYREYLITLAKRADV